MRSIRRHRGSHRREAIDGLVPVEPAGIEPRGRKVGTVRRVRPGLRLQAERVGLAIELSALAGERAVEEIAGIELQARLVGQSSITRPLCGDSTRAARRTPSPGSRQ